MRFERTLESLRDDDGTDKDTAVTPEEPGPVEVGTSATGAPPCCQICPARFISDLQLLQLSESATRAAVGSFAAWHVARTHRPAAETGPIARALLTAVRATDASDAGETALLEVHLHMGTQATTQARTDTAPKKAGTDILAAGQRCCPMCPLDFVPEEAGYSLLETDEHLGDDAATAAAAGLSSALECARRHRARRRRADSAKCAAADAVTAGWVAPRVEAVLARPATETVLAEVAAGGRVGVRYSSETDTKGGARLNPAKSPWGPHSICCNICPAAFHTPGNIPLGPTIGSFLQLPSLSSSPLDVKGGLEGVNGYRGCCTLCGAKLMGSGEWGASPFSEPGSRQQHEGGSGIELAHPGAKGPAKDSKSGLI